MPLQPGDLVLCSGPLPRGISFRERLGGQCPIGVEVFSDALRALPASEAARMAGNSARRVLAR